MSDPIRLRLDLAYDGTDFSGWAIQPGQRTVAGELTAALRLLLREPVRLIVAGRTDAGVHAVGQVAHVDATAAALRSLTPPRTRSSAGGTARAADPSVAAHESLVRRLAGVLAPDLRVRRVAAAAPGFDARFSALRRRYRYRIGTGPWGVEPADRRYVLDRRRPLDTESMALAASALVGLRDFAAFCRPHEGGSTIRELQELSVRRAGDEVHIDVVADAFCHSMVRALVGSLISVGDLRVPAARPRELLDARERTPQIHVAAAHGLTLISVDYPPDDQVRQRSAITRSKRSDGSAP